MMLGVALLKRPDHCQSVVICFVFLYRIEVYVSWSDSCSIDLDPLLVLPWNQYEVKDCYTIGYEINVTHTRNY